MFQISFKYVKFTFKKHYHPEAAPMSICFVADCLLTSAKIFSKHPPALFDDILTNLPSFTIPKYGKRHMISLHTFLLKFWQQF